MIGPDVRPYSEGEVSQFWVEFHTCESGEERRGKMPEMKETTTTMASRPSSSSKSAPTSSKRLLFDRRYGWVIDEWKHPSEEALTGGRRMFCILPLARSLLKMASQSIDIAASSAVKALEKPDVFSPQEIFQHMMRAALRMHK